MVLSAGAFGSPEILERSGIGAKSLLDQLNIPVVVDLPGVGEEYQGKTHSYDVANLSTTHYRPFTLDHSVISQPYLVSNDTITLDGILREDPTEADSALYPSH